jgi:hypothetical protein
MSTVTVRSGARNRGHLPRRAAALAVTALVTGLVGAAVTAGLIGAQHVMADNGAVHSGITVQSAPGGPIGDDNGVINTD